MSKDSPEPIELDEQYATLLPKAERFAEQLASQLQQLIRQHGFTLPFPIKWRVKSWESLYEKISSGRADPPITHVQDFVGLRIILLFKRDAEQICNLIRRTLNVLRSYDTTNRLDPQEFGYLSSHYVVRAPGAWLALPSFAGLDDFQAEIQVRSFAQHLWASASHLLQYKQARAIPRDIARSIHRVSALLETVDLEFERVLQQRDTYRSKLDNLESDEPINVDVLARTLDMLWPADHKVEDERYAFLVERLQSAGIRTQTQVTALIRKHRAYVLEESARRATEIRDAAERYGVRDGKIEYQDGDRHVSSLVDGDTLDRVRRGIFYSHVALTMEALTRECPKNSKS